MKALITGATGLIGSRLVRELEEVVVLGRDPQRAQNKLGNVAAFAWQPRSELPPAEAFSEIDVIFHLAGEPIAKGRWTEKKKRAIRDSRIESTKNLIDTLKSLTKRPSVLVVSSAVGYYGDRGNEKLVEDSAPASTFLAEVCVAWEAEAIKARELGLRVVTARTGIVLAPEGGALPRMLKAFRLGFGGQFGNGRQWMPWIHVDDVVGLLLHAARTEAIVGSMNVVGPNPVTNRTFTKILGQVLWRPTSLPIPRWGLRLAFGEMSQILTASQRALPKVAQNTGYLFRHQKLRSALNSCIGKEE